MSASVSKQFGGIRAVTNASLTVDAGEIHALIGPNGAGKTTLFNLVSGLFPPDTRHRASQRPRDPAACRRTASASRALPARSRSPTCSAPVDLREPAPVAAGAASGTLQCLARHRQLSGSPRRDGRADPLPRPRRHRGDRGRRTLLRRAAAGGPGHRARLQAAGAAAGRAAGGTGGRRARARVEPGEERGRKHPGADRRARHRSRARLLAAGHGDEPGRGADGGHPRRGAHRPARAGGLHRNGHAAGFRPRGGAGSAARRCCGSRASTPSTARAISSTMRRSTCARARSWRCSAATARASPRC